MVGPVEGDRFGIVAHMNQRIAKVRLVAQLVEIQPHQTPAEQRGLRGARHGIDEYDHDQQLGLGPENSRKRDQVHQRAQDNEQKGQRRPGEGPDILHDVLIGNVDQAAGFDFVIVAVVEIVSQEFTGHPFPPAHTQVTLEVAVEGHDGYTDQKTAEIDRHAQVGHVLI